MARNSLQRACDMAAARVKHGSDAVERTPCSRSTWLSGQRAAASSLKVWPAPTPNRRGLQLRN